MQSGGGSVRPRFAFRIWDRLSNDFRSRQECDQHKLTRSRRRSPPLRTMTLIGSGRACRPPTHAMAFLLLTCIPGCAPTHPGETFLAGYISPDKQSKVSHAFVVRNTTSENVEIRAVDRTCTCTSFELGKYRLARGESTALTMGVDITSPSSGASGRLSLHDRLFQRSGNRVSVFRRAV
jgi:Protein of unknown function (DUF1573)